MEFGFDVIETNFPPDPAPIQKVNGYLVCDLTSYDPPTTFPSNILANHDLKVLKLFTDNIDNIPDRIGNLTNLNGLLLSHYESHPHENCTKLPQTLKNLGKLISIDLRNNPLSEFPSQLLSLVNLQELHINNCQLSKLPDNLAQLESLEFLDLSSNSFKSIPVCVTKLTNLSRLYMDNVNLEVIPVCIKDLMKLKRLQLANNQITFIPDELFQLINLNKLHLTNNQIMCLGDNVGNLVNLEYLLLSQNKLTRLPDRIGNLKQLLYLNVYDNMLTCLPERITDLTKVTLLLDSNPLQVPPIHVCNQGLNSIPSIANYFTAMKNTGEIHSKRLKVVLIGVSMAGKTSLVNSLVKGEACHINYDDRTFGVVFHQWKPEPDVDNLELLVVDCAGQRKYQMTHRLFLSEGALFLLAVNLKFYKFDNAEYFHQCIGQWMGLVAALIPKGKILIVPTHVDLCQSQEEIDLKCENIVNCVKEEQQEMLERIDKKIKYIKKTKGFCTPEEDMNTLVDEQIKKKNDLPVISLHYKKVGAEQSVDDLTCMHVLPVSNIGQLQGMMALRKELVRIARNRNLVPTIDIGLPESWVTLERTAKELRKNMDVPCTSLEELQTMLRERDVVLPLPELDSCLSYLNAIGELLYFKEISGLEKNVVLNPYWFSSILKQVFRHDLEERLIYKKSYGFMHSYQFSQDKEQLFGSGIMTKALLRYIWCDEIPPKDDDIIFYQLLAMLTHFGFACEMRTTTSNLDDDESPVCYLMPWFLSSKTPPLDGKWPYHVAENQVGVTVGYSLLQYLPLGVFEQFSIRCHTHNPDEFKHWQNGLCMRFGDVLVLGTVSYIQKCSTITLAARAPRNKLANLWETLLALLKEVEKLLEEWPGMNYLHFTVCPECVKLRVDEPYKFTCNWFKSHQLKMQEAVCKNKTNGQTHRVKLQYLFPPKETSKSGPRQDGKSLEACFDYIAEQLGTRWPVLARKLGSTASKINSIKGDNQGDTHEQAVEMLNTWKQANGKDANVGTMVDKLREIEFKELAEWLEQKTYSDFLYS